VVATPAGLFAIQADAGPGERRHCIDCAVPIPAERLAVNAHALRCVRCKSEKGRLQAKPLAPR